MPASRPADQDPDAFARELGARLRRVRTERHLTLHGVQTSSEGRWKAVVVGSYERGDRAISVQRLTELADFYGVPVSTLLPGGRVPAAPSGPLPGPTLARLVLNLDRLEALETSLDEATAPLARFARAVIRQRSEAPGAALALRHADLATLALMYDATVEELTKLLVQWQVLAPESLILDGTP